MKNLFYNFDTDAHLDYKKSWEQALFVFDTNVLLNLYRYRSTARDELLNVIGELSDRIWVPHHVALEFQRNRPKVIAEQANLFVDVRRAVEKARSSLLSDLEKLQLNRRHSLINPESLISGFSDMASWFFTELDRLQEERSNLTGKDALKEKIESLFDGKVGSPPNDQSEVDEIYKQAERRFKLSIPPGYLDSEKDRDAPDEHFHGGLIYKRKYADYLLWRQILVYASTSATTSIVFVTDDRKEDWWWKIDSNGPKTIGPRPELIEEARTVGNIGTFLMYNPEGFLKFSKEYLETKVSEETLKEVREISIERTINKRHYHRWIREQIERAELAVFVWLKSQFKRVEGRHNGFPDFIAENDGRRFGFEVKTPSRPDSLKTLLRDVAYQAYYELNEGNLHEITVVWVVYDQSQLDQFKSALRQVAMEKMPAMLRMVLGIIEDPISGEVGFFPIAELP